MLLSMSEIVFQVIAFGFEHIVIFVFGFPSTSLPLGNQRNGCVIQLMVGNEGIMVKRFASGSASEREFTPIDEL